MRYTMAAYSVLGVIAATAATIRVEGGGQNLDAALRVARAGDDVVVRPGTYHAPVGGFRIDTPAVRVIAAGAGDSVKLVPGVGTRYGFVVEADHAEIEGFELSGFEGAAILVATGKSSQIVRNHLHDSAAGIVLQSGGGTEIRDNVIRHCGIGILEQDGEVGAGGRLIVHNILHHNEGGGIRLAGEKRGRRALTYVLNNRFADNGASGSAYGSRSDVVMAGNVFLREVSASGIPPSARGSRAAPVAARAPSPARGDPSRRGPRTPDFRSYRTDIRSAR